MGIALAPANVRITATVGRSTRNNHMAGPRNMKHGNMKQRISRRRRKEGNE